MSVGIMFANGARSAGSHHAITVAESAEHLGYESLWAVQHIVVPVQHASRYPYSEQGEIPGGAFTAIPDPLIWLAHVAARTTAIRLATGVLILPQQHPLIAAKQLATLDQLSGGRVMAGVGAGWLREEFEAVGATFSDRGQRLDEAVEVMRAVWSQRVSTYDGPTVHFDGIAMEPKPVRGSIPIVVGGHTPPATRRAGRLGDGFFPLGRRGQPLRDLVNAMRRSAAAAGRDPASIEITAEAPRTADEAQAIRELGVHRVVVNAPHVETAEVPGALAARMTRVRDMLG